MICFYVVNLDDEGQRVGRKILVYILAEIEKVCQQLS